jgi:hypothetical protein
MMGVQVEGLDASQGLHNSQIESFAKTDVRLGVIKIAKKLTVSFSCIYNLELITDIAVISFVLLECSPLARKELGTKVHFCRRCAFRRVLRFRIGSMF